MTASKLLHFFWKKKTSSWDLLGNVFFRCPYFGIHLADGMTFCVKEVAVDQFIFGVQIVSILLQKHGTIYQVTSIVSNKWKKKKKKNTQKKSYFWLKRCKGRGLYLWRKHFPNFRKICQKSKQKCNINRIKRA